MTDRRYMFKQFIFGDTIVSREPLSPTEMEKLVLKAGEVKGKAALPSQDAILAVFSRLSKAWSDPEYRKRQEAVKALEANSNMSREFIRAVFEEFTKLISPEYLLHKLEGDLGSAEIQDNLVSQRDEVIRLIVRPAGLVLHVASGNVFLACIESIINGMITKNINFLKMSSSDRDFPLIFAESIREFDGELAISPRLAVLWWRGGDREIEDVFKKHMDRIVFWGGPEALRSWERNLSEATVLIRHGHKISFGVVSEAGLASAELPNLTDNIALDIAIWDQKACNCPQVLFVEGAVQEDVMRRFIDSLAESLKNTNSAFPPGRRSDDEYVEVMKTRELAMAARLAEGRPVSVIGPKTFDWTIIFEDKSSGREFTTSPLNRTIIVRRYASLKTLAESFKGYSFYMQTVGCCLDKSEIAEYAMRLSSLGVTRLCPFGIMAVPSAGTPHDGSFALRDLTRFTVVEC